ncbi:MAG: hypothetical protein AB1757_10325 [Acidobacteriota bacterium]
MKIKSLIFAIIFSISVSVLAIAQEGQPGFVILLKNGSAVRGRTLTRETSGQLRLAMTETASGEPKSYAIIDVEDTESIRASSSDTDSILIKLHGGSELRCKEFSLNGNSVIVKLGTQSRIEVRWEDITSISFNG